MSYGEEESHHSVEVLFKQESMGSVEDPQDEWSSLLLFDAETNVKKLQYEEGLYNPGSGEICTKHMQMSASSVLRHVYYKYPAIMDPGIEAALQAPIPTILYANDGQELYLALCDEMSVAPIRSFYRSLLTPTVNLGYYGISAKGIRAICAALRLNKFVEVLDLSDSWLNNDACFHLGEMLADNSSILELNLKGCRIGKCGAQTLSQFLPYNRKLRKLDLSKNQLEDAGVEYLCKAIFKDVSFVELCLSYNNITAVGLGHLVDVLEIRNKLTHLDLSWNAIFSAMTVQKLCQQLIQNDNFEMLDLSWNSLGTVRMGTAISSLIKKGAAVKTIILRNNTMKDNAITLIAKSLEKSETLHTLDLSNNPLTVHDALLLLATLKNRQVKLQYLLMDNVTVNEAFVRALKDILSLKFRKSTVVTHGYVKPTFVIDPADMKAIIVKRAAAVGKLPKKPKNKVDFPMLMLQLKRANPEPMIVAAFVKELRRAGLFLEDDHTGAMSNYFAGPRANDKNKSKTINLDAIVEYVTRLWPDTKLPPTPPPEPEPEPIPKRKDKKKK